MPPHLSQTAKRYRQAMGYAPSPGYPSRVPTSVMTHPRHFAGPIYSASVHPGMGDGDGLGGILDDLKAAGSALISPATEKIDRLEVAIKTILVFSGIAAATGLISLVRR